MDRNKRKKVKRNSKKRRRNRIMRLMLFAMLIVTVLLTLMIGFFVVRHFYINIYNRTDIILDAGHGGKDPGANNGDAIEKEITLSIAKKTQEILEDAGYKVKMIREEDDFIELIERPKIANRRNAKAFISIHCNSSEDGEGKGIETFYTDQKEESDQKLAELIQNAIIEYTEAEDRGAKTADYTVLVRTEMPAVLIETGFLTNSAECESLTDEEYQKKVAEGIAEGILAFFEKNKY